MSAPGSERMLVDYLLGRLPESERTSLEGRLFRDEELDEELLATTDDLIHEYLRGALAEDDRARFESHFLADPENGARLALVRDLLASMERRAANGAVAAPAAPLRSSRAAWWLAAAAALAVALFFLARGSRDEPRQVADARPRGDATPSSTPVPPRMTKPRADAPPAAAIERVRLPARADRPVEVPLTAETRTVRVEVAVDDESPGFDAVLETEEGREVWRAEGLAPDAGSPLVLEIPARLLAAATYALRIEAEALREGEATRAEYRLRVTRAR